MSDRDTLIKICEVIMESKFDVMTQFKIIKEYVYLWTLDLKNKPPTIDKVMEKMM